MEDSDSIEKPDDVSSGGFANQTEQNNPLNVKSRRIRREEILEGMRLLEINDRSRATDTEMQTSSNISTSETANAETELAEAIDVLDSDSSIKMRCWV